jgi:hypothetical protein
MFLKHIRTTRNLGSCKLDMAVNIILGHKQRHFTFLLLEGLKTRLYYLSVKVLLGEFIT